MYHVCLIYPSSKSPFLHVPYRSRSVLCGRRLLQRDREAQPKQVRPRRSLSTFCSKYSCGGASVVHRCWPPQRAYFLCVSHLPFPDFLGNEFTALDTSSRIYHGTSPVPCHQALLQRSHIPVTFADIIWRLSSLCSSTMEIRDMKTRFTGSKPTELPGKKTMWHRIYRWGAIACYM